MYLYIYLLVVKMSRLKQFYEQDHFFRWSIIPNQELDEYRRAETTFLFNHVREGSTLLDIGVGTGRSLEAVLERVSKAYGIDFSKLMLNEARKSLGQNP